MDQVYDGFISYSHAADDLLAPRLQSALQRFAKPWWKRQAVRIFRDESSLSANPHLWSAITEALDSSGWFVLLLSPDAAASEWVNQEITYWVENRDPKRILPVVTDGEFGWDGEVTGDAVPDALRGVFTEEPRWVDLRFARQVEQLDLQNPAFASAVADIASAIRGIPKDELASEEVRQHRRTVRTAWAAGGLVTVLAIVAVGFGVQSARNAGEAERQAEIADLAVGEVERQEELSDTANRNSEARRLLASATDVLSEDAQLSMLLLLHALSTTVDQTVREEVIGALRKAAVENRLLARFEVPSGPTSLKKRMDGVTNRGRGTYSNRAALSPDGETIFHASRATNTLAALAVGDGTLLWEQVVDPDEMLDVVAVSPDGELVAMSIIAPLGSMGRVAVFDADTGDQVAALVAEGCTVVVPVAGGFSADGRWFTVLTGSEGCVNPAEPAGADWAVVYDTSTWQERERYFEPGATRERFRILQDSEVAILAFEDANGQPTVRVVEYPALDEVASFRAQWPALSPTGDSVAYLVERLQENIAHTVHIRRDNSRFEVPVDLGHTFEVVRGYLTDDGFDLDPVLEPITFSPDGSMLAVASWERDFVINSTNGTIEIVLDDSGPTFSVSWSGDGSKLLTTHEDELLIWAVVDDPGRFSGALSSQDWAGYAAESLVRGLTAQECLTYDIEPCPTLEESRGG